MPDIVLVAYVRVFLLIAAVICGCLYVAIWYMVKPSLSSFWIDLSNPSCSTTRVRLHLTEQAEIQVWVHSWQDSQSYHAYSTIPQGAQSSVFELF